MAQRLGVMWQITVPVTDLSAGSDNDVLILPLQWITDDPAAAHRKAMPA